MNYNEAIESYQPVNLQEKQDKKVILDYIKHFGDNVLLRDNEIAHITSSGFIMNPSLDKVLFVHHNIRNVWSWTGGHADGEKDLQYVAIKEAKEETGVINIFPLTKELASIDILTVNGHMKQDNYINVHLHLSAAYILIADEDSPVKVCPNENSAVEWFPLKRLTPAYFDKHDVYLYQKLISFAHKTLL